MTFITRLLTLSLTTGYKILCVHELYVDRFCDWRSTRWRWSSPVLARQGYCRVSGSGVLRHDSLALNGFVWYTVKMYVVTYTYRRISFTMLVGSWQWVMGITQGGSSFQFMATCLYSYLCGSSLSTIVIPDEEVPSYEVRRLIQQVHWIVLYGIVVPYRRPRFFFLFLLFSRVNNPHENCSTNIANGECIDIIIHVQ